MRTGVRTVLFSAQIGLWGVLGIGLLAGAGVRSETRPAPPLSANEVQELQAKLDKDIAELTRQIDDSPKNVEAYSARGDRLFFRGKFAEAVADFEKMVELQPSLAESHWRRGIAWFYAGQYDQAAHQFEIYHSFDNIDRENGIWRYLSQVKALGREKAREGLLKYEKDDREPFPDIYQMFAGKLKGEEMLKKIEAAELPAAEKEKRLFYAELYVGLNEAVEGRADAAEDHLAKSTANRWGAKAGGGPGWMWHVGRVHHDLLRAAREKKAEAKPQ
jgi:lipoprotein NlpI